jgi:hypothetical protein
VSFNRQVLLEAGQPNHALLRRGALEAALGRFDHHPSYGEGWVAGLAAAIEGVAQAQAFEVTSIARTSVSPICR